jgi:hypothetical protein
MGYDHFALIATPIELDEGAVEKIKSVCKELRATHEEILFGKVHHLCNENFIKQRLWPKYDEFFLKLHEKLLEPTIFYMYVCEHDGQCLEKYIYENGIRVTKHNGFSDLSISLTTSDEDVECRWSIDTLSVKRNLTILYNDSYGQDNIYD